MTSNKNFNSKAFMKICKENHDLCKAKSKDYGKNNIIKFGLKGIIMRMYEKIERGYNIIWEGNEAEVKDEAVENIFKDVINYGIIGLLLKRGEWK